MKNIFTKTLNFLRNNFWSIIFFGIVAFSTPLFVHAGVSDVVGEALVWILKGPLYLLGQLVVFLIDLLSYLFEFNNFVSVPVVTQGWIVVRDLLNMFFVLIMMIMAIATILPVGALSSYNIKSLMIKLLIATITINFSKTILGVMIDAGQIVMLQFVASFREAIAVNLADGAMLPEILAYADNANTGPLEAVIAMLIGIVFMVIFSFILIIYVGVLLYRIISLWVLIILSPLAFFAQAVPSMASYAKEFWSKFTSQLTIGIVIAFFMWLALTIMYMTDTKQDWMSGQGTGVATQLNDYNTGGSQGGGQGSVCSSKACDYYKILRFIIAIIILMMAMQYTQKAGGFAGKFAGKMSGKMMALGAGAVGGFGAAKYLKKKGKDLGKKALDRGKALGSTAWQATGGQVMTGLKNKLGTEGGKGMAIAGAGGLGMALATGGTLPLAIAAGAAGYGGYKMLKQAYKNHKEKKQNRLAMAEKTEKMLKENPDEGKFLDENGNKTTSDKAHATWNENEQAYKIPGKKYKEQTTKKKVFEGDADYNELSASADKILNNGVSKQEKVGERKWVMSGKDKIYEDENPDKYDEELALGGKQGSDPIMKSYYEEEERKKIYEDEAGYAEVLAEEKQEESKTIFNGQTMMVVGGKDVKNYKELEVKKHYEGEEGYDESKARTEEYEREYIENGLGDRYYKDQAKDKAMYDNLEKQGNGKLGTEKAYRSYSADTKKYYEGDAGYDLVRSEVKQEEKDKMVEIGKKRQRFEDFNDGKDVRRYDETSKTYRKVDPVTGEFDFADDGLDIKSKEVSAIGAMYQANKSKFGVATNKAKEEKVEKGVSRMSSLDDDVLKKLITSSGNHDDRKFAALALAKKGATIEGDLLKAANIAVGQDPYAKKQFNAQLLKAGGTGNLGDNTDKIVEAIEKGMLKASELKVTEKSFNPNVLEAMFKINGKQTARLLDELGKDAKSKNIINQTMRAYLQKTQSSSFLGNKELAQGVYAKRTGNFSEAFATSTGDNKVDVKKLTDFFRKNSSQDTLQKISMPQLDNIEVKEALQECMNASLFNNVFKNDEIGVSIKEKIGDILLEAESEQGKNFVNKLRKGNNSVYFRDKK